MDRVEYQSIIIQDLINLEKSDELDLSPWYQRRSVWTIPQKSYLINTLLERKPIPAIYIRHSIDLDRGMSVREVVDGQQRCRTILGFPKNEFSSNHPDYSTKVLYSQLKKKHQQEFLLTSIPVGFLLGATDADVIDIFGRINSVSKTLNPQEKRNAAYSGEMKQFCLKQASSRINFWREFGIFSANDIARMNETQFISDMIYNLANGLSDFNAKKLTDMYRDNDDSFEGMDEMSDRLSRTFDFIASLKQSTIAETIMSRHPIFFSFFIVIDSMPRVKRLTVEEAIIEVDARFNASDYTNEQDLRFREACTASTQRIAQRKVRDDYIRSFM